MENPEDASRAFALSGTPLHGKPIRVDYSQNERAGERPPERDRDPYPPRTCPTTFEKVETKTLPHKKNQKKVQKKVQKKGQKKKPAERP